MRPLCIGVDFDGVVAKEPSRERFPEVSELLPSAERVLTCLVRVGHKLILWTCSEDRQFQDAMELCRLVQLPIHLFNEVPLSLRYLHPTDLLKLGVDLYIDDWSAYQLGGFDWGYEERLLEGVGVLLGEGSVQWPVLTC